jgi:glycosyltransferase involved in cell wall biosynthesis
MDSRLAEEYAIQALDIGHGPMRAASRLLLTLRLLARLFVVLWRHPTLRLIHIHSSAGTPLFEKGVFILLSILWRKRVLLHVHGGRFRELWSKYGPFRRGLTRAILARCHGVIVLSDTWLPFYRNELGYRGELHCLPNSVPVERVAAEHEDERVRLLYVGHLKPEKGLLDLRQAWALLPESVRQNTCLLLMGEGDTPENEKLVKEAYADLPPEQVQFLGALSGHQKWVAFARSSALVLPSHSEDLPLTLLEGMALGLPLIATRVGAIPSLVIHEKEGLLVEAHDIGELAKALERIITSRESRESMGNAGKLKFDEQHSFTRYLDRLAGTYAHLLN